MSVHQTDDLVRELILKLLEKQDLNEAQINKIKIEISGIPELVRKIKNLEEGKQDNIKLVVAVKEHFWKTFFAGLLVLTGSVISFFREAFILWLK